MLLGCASTAFAGVDPNESHSQIPVIRISGDGEALYDPDGNKIFHYKDIAKLVTGESESGEDNSEMYKAMAENIIPTIVKGALTDDWNDMYAALEEEISKIFANSLLDENGNVTNGSGLSERRKAQMEDKRTHDKKGSKGYYAWENYWFHYDWRLDPMETADVFNSYIKDIKKTTGCEKVGIMASCLGTNIVMAYVSKYGVEDIQGISFDGSVVGGAEILSEVICATSDAISDQFASVTRTSFGATTSTVYDTLSEEYIAQREAEGKGKYISPDKHIDASTCIFPDYTWFVKGSSHSNWTSYELKIMLEVATADRQLTIDDFPYTQFFVYYEDVNEAEPMTEENCNTEYWTADESVDKPATIFDQIKVSFNAIIRWLKALFELFSEKIAEG